MPYRHDIVPTLLFPREAADSLSIPYRKSYALTMVDVDHLGEVFDYVDGLLRRRART